MRRSTRSTVPTTVGTSFSMRAASAAWAVRPCNCWSVVFIRATSPSVRSSSCAAVPVRSVSRVFSCSTSWRRDSIWAIDCDRRSESARTDSTVGFISSTAASSPRSAATDSVTSPSQVFVPACVSRTRETQAGTKTWLGEVTESVAALRGELAAVEEMKPTVESVRADSDRLSQSMAQIESRRQLVEQLNTRLTDLTGTAAQLDERTEGLAARMNTTDQQLQGLTAHAAEAARIEKLVPTVVGTVERAERRMTQIDTAVTTLEGRAQSLELLAEQTRALGQELQLRQAALNSATEHLARASQLRAEAASIAQQLEERAGQLTGALTGATDRTAALTTTLEDLENRAGNLRFVHKRMAEFEQRLAKWPATEEQLRRALEQTAQRQATVDALQADLYRLFEVAERAVEHVRSLASAQAPHAKRA